MIAMRFEKLADKFLAFVLRECKFFCVSHFKSGIKSDSVKKVCVSRKNTNFFYCERKRNPALSKLPIIAAYKPESV